MTKLKRLFYNYKYTILCIFYFIVICVIFNSSGSLVIYLISIPSSLTLVLIMNILSRTKYTLIFTFILSFLIAFDAYFAYTYKNPVFLGIMASIFETDKTEAAGALKEVWVTGLIIIACTLFLVINAQKELKKHFFNRKKSLQILIIYLAVFIPLCYTVIIGSTKGLKTEFKTNPVLTLQRITFSCMPVVYNNLLTLVAYEYEMYRFKKYGSQQRTFPVGTELGESEEIPDKIFLIIGESSWRKHYSLYGYPVPTTPFLDSLRDANPSILNFYNAISPAPITREAVRIGMSFSTCFDIEPFFKQKNMVELAKYRGYETLWISNQNKIGMYESYIGFIASSADSNYFMETFIRNDMDLIKVIKEKFKSGKKQFFVIHLTGSHMPYEFGYGEEDKKDIPAKEETMEVHYDRTIRRTDRVLENIYKITEKEESFIINYFSDHGEIIGLGHGFVGKGSSQFEIPYVTINKSAVPLDSIIMRYTDTETHLLNSSNTINILAEAMGYTLPDDYLPKAVTDGKHILHVDSKVYLYTDIQKEDQ